VSTADLLRALLLFTMLALAVLALRYLSRRHLDWPYNLAWGLLAVIIPVLGPILVISLRPGRWAKSRV
jgi:hypothetical protein